MSEYDAFASDFSATRDRPWPEFEVLFKHLKKGEKLLDLGCGNGRLRKFMDPSLIAPGAYFGTDISENLLSIARKNYPADHFFEFDFSKFFPFGADQFEVVAAVASFHHLLTTQHQKHFFRECHRVLKPGGKLFLTSWILPSRYKWDNLKHGRFKNWVIPFGPEKHPRTYRKVSLWDLRWLGWRHGFKVLEAQKFYGKNNYEGRNNVVVLAKY